MRMDSSTPASANQAAQPAPQEVAGRLNLGNGDAGKGVEFGEEFTAGVFRPAFFAGGDGGALE